MAYTVNESAIRDYSKIFKNKLTNGVIELVNENFIINKHNVHVSLKFFDDYVVFVSLKNGEITRLIKLSYQYIIPDEVLAKLQNLNNLPPRLDRIKVLGINFLRVELIDSLKLGRIKIEKNFQYAFWEKYDIQFRISDNLTLVDVIMNRN